MGILIPAKGIKGNYLVEFPARCQHPPPGPGNGPIEEQRVVVGYEERFGRFVVADVGVHGGPCRAGGT